MPIPLVAAALAPELLKVLPEVSKLAQQGGIKDNNLVDVVYQPLVKVKKNWPGYKEAIARYPSGEMPDPHFPNGVRYQIPAWFAVMLLLAGFTLGGVVGLGLTGNLKNYLKSATEPKKKGIFGLGILPI